MQADLLNKQKQTMTAYIADVLINECPALNLEDLI